LVLFFLIDRRGVKDRGEHRELPELVSKPPLNKDGAFGFWSADAVRARADTSTLVDAALGLASQAGDRGRNI
jgi:hypothetical protein